MSEERDTHFQGFAKLLYDELSHVSSETIIHEDLNEREKQAILRIIASRAYDLVKHALWEIDYRDSLGIDYAVKNIPDLTAWTEREWLF